MRKEFSFQESLLFLLIMLIVLGTGVIAFGLSPQIPVLTVIGFYWPGYQSARYHGMIFLLVLRKAYKQRSFQFLFLF